jgi:uncharacterized protein YndB with AHSA1/START domain
MESLAPEQITHEVVIDAPVERVWAILTEAEHIREWFAFDGAAIDLRPGGALVLTWKEHGTFHARIEEVTPPHRFSYRWAMRPDEQPEQGNATLVQFSLIPEGSGTRLRVVESGFRELDLPAERQSQHAAENTDGWVGAFRMLDEYARRQAA